MSSNLKKRDKINRPSIKRDTIYPADDANITLSMRVKTAVTLII